MEWIEPKTDWSPADGVADSDLNRIEGNIQMLDLSRTGLNVKRFGALGDGSRDNESPYIQAALDAGAGKEVYIPAGTYYLQDMLIARSGTKIRLAPNARLIRNASINMLLLWDGGNPTGYNGAHDIVIEGGTWDMNRSQFPNSNTAISFSHCHNIIIKDVKILNVPENHHIEINASRDVKVLNSTFIGMTITGDRRSECVQIDAAISEEHFPWYGTYDNTCCDDVLIQGCTFRAADRGVGTHAAPPSGSKHQNIRVIGNHFENLRGQAVRGMIWEQCTISNNTMYHCGYGVDINTGEGGNYYSVFEIVISGNVMQYIDNDSNGRGILLFGDGGQQVYYASITGNTIAYTADNGIMMSNATYCTVAGNVIRYPGNNGIYCGTGSSFNSITGNTIIRSSARGISLYDGAIENVVNANVIRYPGYDGILVNLNSSYNTVSDNKIRDASSGNVDQYYGIRLSGDSNYNFVTNNRIQGNTMLYGISITSSCVSNRVFHNYALSAGSAGNFQDNGQSTQTELSGNVV